MIEYIVFWVSVLFIIVANALFDKNDEISKNIYVNHEEESLLTLFFVTLIGLGCFISPVIIGANWKSFIFNLSLYFPIRWILFDLYLNHIRGKELNYIGDLTDKSSWTDKLLHRVGKDKQYFLKIGLLVLVIVVNLLLNKYL